MTARTGITSGGEGSALPGKRARRKKHPAEQRDQDRAVMMIVEDDGRLRVLNEAGRQWMRANQVKRGERLVSYHYRIHDEKQFRRAHLFCRYLRENTEEFAGMTDHEVLKELQLRYVIACVKQRVLIPAAARKAFVEAGLLAPQERYWQALQPKSIAPGFMDAGEFEQLYKRLANAVAEEYFGVIDAAAVDEMIKLMPRDHE